MQAEVISIGDELTSGQRLDTNSRWLSQQLNDLGIRVAWHTTVDDQLQTETDVFRIAAGRADVVISTGGLGPTADDLTREALAAVVAVELVRDQAAWEHIQRLFARRNRAMPERNIVQAMFPRGSRVIHNPQGTAPGIDLEIPRDNGSVCRVFALPGVPGEMRDMWSGTVQPAIQTLLGDRRRRIRHHQLRCYGAGESAVEAMLPDLIRRGRSPTVGITASQATITLRITAESDSEDGCDAMIAGTAAMIRECLGDLVFGEGDDELQHALVRMLAERGRSLAIVEFDSGGLLSRWLTEADPARQVFRGGITIRHPALAAEMLGAGQLLTMDSALTADTLCQLANRCRAWFGADLAIALGPFPAAAAADSVPEKVRIALADHQDTVDLQTSFSGHPSMVVARVIKDAMNALRLRLLHGQP